MSVVADFVQAPDEDGAVDGVADMFSNQCSRDEKKIQLSSTF